MNDQYAHVLDASAVLQNFNCFISGFRFDSLRIEFLKNELYLSI